ncbi:MAG TPA: ABC transporter permease [Pseudonocardiaceae bacterium]|jgi:peptide/nickel transport system permease protein|nr:ABC transporter permease [Pseudonocardiaceae bacterium]
MGQLRRALPRVAQYALVLWVAATINFALPYLAPGDPVDYLYAGPIQGLTEEQLSQIRTGYGLDRPILEQYAGFWTGLTRGELGISVAHNRPVVDLLFERLPWTLALIGLGLLGATMLGVILGAAAAWWRGRRRDIGLVTGVLAVDSMPSFWIGMMLIAVFAVQLGWFPSFGATEITASGAAAIGEMLRRLVLPVVTITLAIFGSIFLLTRAAMISVLDEPFVRLARAKGVSERRIALRHALRNALLPVFTNVTVMVGTLLSSLVVVETVFAYPGLGRLIYEAVTARDYPLLQGAFLLITVGVIGLNLLADLIYPLLDPRVRRDVPAAEAAL